MIVVIAASHLHEILHKESSSNSKTANTTMKLTILNKIVLRICGLAFLMPNYDI